MSEPTVQFIHVPKLREKRQNSERRKARSRDAARCRRGKESEIFHQLSSALPFTDIDHLQLDKASIMRLTTSFVRLRHVLPNWRCIYQKEVASCTSQLSAADTVNCLNGFVMVTSLDGDLIYISENVSTFLGVNQIDMMGHSLYDFSHPYDHEELRELFSKRESDGTVFLRLKCTLSANGKVLNLKSANWKVVNCKCHQLAPLTVKKESEDEDWSTAVRCNHCLVFICDIVPHPSNIDSPLDSSTFLTQQSIDFRLSFVDSRVADILGYDPCSLLGTSVLNYHHAADSVLVEHMYRVLIVKGQCEIESYRFLAKSGGYVWLRTQATVISNSRTQKPNCIVSVHYLLGNIEDDREILSIDQIPIKSPISSDSPMSIADSGYRGDDSINEEDIHHPLSPTSPMDTVTEEQKPFPLCGGPKRLIAAPIEKVNQNMSMSDINFLKCLAPEAGDTMIPLSLPDPEGLPIFDELLLESALLSAPAIFVDNESILRDMTTEEERSQDWDWCFTST